MDSALGTLVADLYAPGARAQFFGIYAVRMRLAGTLMLGAGEVIVRWGGLFSLIAVAALGVTAGLAAVGRLLKRGKHGKKGAPFVLEILGGAASLPLGGVVFGLTQ